MDMKHSLLSFRPTRHLALGLGAAGLVLGASGATAAATALVQPAGALSVQVPAVAVREQNVNSAGRIRVALPKTSVGVNGSVSVSNLPTNSAGRLRTQNGTGVAHQASLGPWVQANAGQILTIANVTGAGTFTGLHVAASQGDVAMDGLVTVTIDGSIVFRWDVGWANYTGGGGPLWGATFSGLDYIEYFPPQALSFQKSLVVTVQNENNGSSAASYWADVWYTTGG